MKENIHKIFRTAVALACVGAAEAATVEFKFDSDPADILTIARGGDNGTLSALAGAWFPTGGSTLQTGVDPSTNGYFAITQTTPTETVHGMRSVIVFDDFDSGMVVGGFTFAADLRIGGGIGNPADGFSLSFARANDSVVLNPAGGRFGDAPNGTAVNVPEEGTTTGLVLSFDAFANGGTDPIGLTIKYDNVVVTNIPMTTLNGACEALNSIQTGPAGTAALGRDGSIARLCWQPLSVNLGVDGLLSVAYKSNTLVTNLQLNYIPGPSRLVLAGRTGGSYQEQDIDNIRITTVTPSSPIVGTTVGGAFGFSFRIVDQGTLTPDANSLVVTLDGQTVTPSVERVTDAGTGANYTVVSYQNANTLLAANSVHTNVITFSGSGFDPVRKTNVFTVAPYTILSSALKAPGTVDTAQTGFSARFNQLATNRVANISTVERELAGLYIHPDTGFVFENVAPTPEMNVDVVNITDNGGNFGNFSLAQQPPQNVGDIAAGTTSAHDNFAAEFVGILELPVGMYQLGVNHDDLFQLTVGSEPRDVFSAVTLGSNMITRDDQIFIVVTNAGFYPVRLLWGEGSPANHAAAGAAGGHIEFYVTDFATGAKLLINQADVTGAIKAYRDLSALTQPYVSLVSPTQGEVGVSSNRPVVVKIKDGATATVVESSVTLKVNGQGTATVAKVGNETTVTLTGHGIADGPATAALSYRLSTGETINRTWNYTIYGYGFPIFDIELNEGAGTNFVDSILGQAGWFLVNDPTWTNGPSGAPNDYAVVFNGVGARRGTMPDPNRLVTLGADWLGSNGDYTLEAWVNLPVGFSPTVRMILYTYEGLPGFALSINTARTLHTTTYNLNDINSTLVVPNDGQWHHVAVVHKNGETMNFYLDGVLGQSQTYIRGPGQRANLATTVGAASNGANPTTGILDRLIFTKGALAPADFDFPLAAPAQLSISRAAGQVTISWSTALTGYKLQSATELQNTGTQWTDVQATPIVSGSTASVTVTPDGTTKFYRLIKAP
jgi:hypothetical protein